MSSPIVDIPIILVEEDIVLLQLRGGHLGEVVVREGGEEEVTFEGSPLAALVCSRVKIVSEVQGSRNR